MFIIIITKLYKINHICNEYYNLIQILTLMNSQKHRFFNKTEQKSSKVELKTLELAAIYKNPQFRKEIIAEIARELKHRSDVYVRHTVFKGKKLGLTNALKVLAVFQRYQPSIKLEDLFDIELDSVSAEAKKLGLTK